MQGKNEHRAGEDCLPIKLLADNVTRLRADVGWSTRAFAEHTGLNLRTLYEIEHAKYGTVSLNTLERLARGFGVHLSCLVASPHAEKRPFSEMPSREAVAVNLVYWRGAQGWTQQQLANESSVNRAVIAAVERQSRNASLDVLDRLARALGVSLPQLLTDI